MKRIQRGPVRGISLKLQEEERERRMDFVPDVSCLDLDVVEINYDTHDMLKSIDFPEMAGIRVVS
jgi:small subunit ribosomal protein S17e